MTGYILIHDETEYVESINEKGKTFDTSSVRKDAIVFKNKEEAHEFAILLDCEVVTI